MNGNDKNTLILQQAKQIVLATIHPLPGEIVGLNEAQQFHLI